MTRTLLQKGKTKTLACGVCGLLVLCFTFAFLPSCEDNSVEWLADDSSYEARLEEGCIALDDREYARARDLLLELNEDYPGDPLVLQYLSNAYAGLAGLDTFNYLLTIDRLLEENPGSIDMAGTVLGDATGLIEVGDIDKILSNLNKAIETLKKISPQTEEQKVQLGLLGLNRTSIIIAKIVAKDRDLADIDTVELTEAGLSAVYEAEDPNFADVAGIDEDCLEIDEDKADMDSAVSSIETITGDRKNDLSESFGEFSNNIDPDDDGVSPDDLEGYIISM